MTEHNFIFLDEDSMRLLESDERARLSYVDFLSQIHDLLVPYASESDHPRFAENQIYRELGNSLYAFPKQSLIWIITISNMEAALSLEGEVGLNQKEAPPDQHKKKQLNIFLSDVLNQYEQIRRIRSKARLPHHI